MIIQYIHLKHLRNTEFIQFIKDVLNIISANDPAELKVDNQYNHLKQLFDDLEVLFSTAHRSRITEELKALDFRRDTAINGISALISGYRRSADETVCSHAKLLADNLDLYRHSIARESYQGETADLNKVIDDWLVKPGLKAAVTALNLDVWMTELADVNTKFNERYLARVEELASLPQSNLKAKRTEALTAFYMLRERLDACYTYNEGAEPFASVVNTINALVERYNALLANRKPHPTLSKTTSP